jgi:hypothetical protein
VFFIPENECVSERKSKYNQLSLLTAANQD